jgi:glucokinase
MILAGDIGGTKCNLGLFREEGRKLRPIFQRRLGTRDYPGFEAVVEDFLKQAATEVKDPAIDAAGFGVAGVVADGRHYSENLPWVVDVSALKSRLKLKNITLLNDIAATALSLEILSPSDMVTLNPGNAVTHGTQVVIAAGTGLGEALLFWDGARYRVAPAEGGQADFAPRSEREIQLLRRLKEKLAQVTYEEIVSGRGFLRIHEFLEPSVRHESFESASGNAAGEITERALAKTCDVCVKTVAFWVEMFAGATRNIAMHAMALGGVYLAGGIPVKILSHLQDGIFFKTYCGSGKLSPMLARIPIFVVTNEEGPMLGAAYEALNSSRGL